jgi:hypothetical protein
MNAMNGLHANLLQLLRTLVLMATRDDERLQQYREALSIVASVATGRPSAAVQAWVEPQPGGSSDGEAAGVYPKRELQWLVTTCWNRGAHHARFSRYGRSCTVGYRTGKGQGSSPRGRHACDPRIAK